MDIRKGNNMPHAYRLSLTHLFDQRGNPVDRHVCEFEFENHDDLAAIIQRARDNAVVPDAEVLEFCVGLKLLAEVAIRHKDDPVFAEFFPHLGAFIRSIKTLKAGKEA
ncbi:DUF3861 domain-containing protein [Rhizobium panacihumi]|uniref:DUF3861 domain-containing protein n=1 Tax=Rhizobium panacihumi TaxID=2008450 RepID=UPI003D7B5734